MGVNSAWPLSFYMVAKLERNIRRQGELSGISFSEYMCRITFCKRVNMAFCCQQVEAQYENKSKCESNTDSTGKIANAGGC